ncbi:SIS domain-containing protein [Marivivens marinus]|uniref:SIS domain-containing protein n=1 Tax=Marivivens marinus TaxID=3110173 RepID=UPI003B84B10F
MSMDASQPGRHMAAEIEEAAGVFARAAALDLSAPVAALGLAGARAFYTIARGSSDAAANILSYEFMRELGVPVTSLPPSVFSVGAGVSVDGAAGLIISQSGASEDLIRAAQGLRDRGATVAAITNVAGSGVEGAAQVTVPINAGPEHAVPATKTVIGSVGAGLALLAAMSPDYAARLGASVETFEDVGSLPGADHDRLRAALLRARHVYVVGRDTGFGAAHEVALKIKETCAIHAEAYSASEVLHGPLQLATNPLTVLVLDTGAPGTAESIENAVARFRATGSDVHRIAPTVAGLTPAAAAAAILRHIYPVILDTALALGHDPDAPATLSKVTVTR